VIKQITKHIENTDEVKGGLKAIVASVDIGKSWKLGEATQADVSYAQMALAFEYYMENSKNLYDPFTADLDQSLWLRYIGDSFLAANDVEISEESTGMGSYHLSYLAYVLEIINVWHCLCLGITTSIARENILNAYSNSSLRFLGSNFSIIVPSSFLSMSLKKDITSKCLLW
jgi:hypothetical protein